MGNLPLQVIVEPHLLPLDDDEGRDLVDGHTIKAGGFIFTESGADHIYYEQSSKLRAWLSEHGYKHLRDLQNTYMATPGLCGIWGREVMTEAETEQLNAMRSTQGPWLLS